MRHVCLPTALLVALCGVAAAQTQPTFIARADRSAASVGEPFLFEVTLSLDDTRADGYRAPEFRGFRVVGETPSQSTQVQMGGGTAYVRTVYSWQYELVPNEKGTFTIGRARIRVDGRELQTGTVTIAVVDAGQAPSPRNAPRASGIPGLHLPLDDQAEPPPPPRGEAANFVRAVPTKTKAYVGEQITVEWQLYLSERQDKYQPVKEPHTEGFWAEEIPVNSQRGLSLTRQSIDGQQYLVAPIMKKALFPLRAGRLTVTPLEAEISRVDFFGSAVATQRLRAAPLTFEVQQLPTAGQPVGFDPAAVGRFALTAQVDRDRVGIGDAVTLTVQVKGQGNIRKLPAPKLPPLAGWKVYDPKTSVDVQPGDTVTGSKTVEYLLLPERPGTTTIPSFTLAFFDPSSRAYAVEKSAPLRLEVVGETAPAAGVRTVGVPAGQGGENVLGVDIRPPRTRAKLRRDHAATFYRSRAFIGVVVAPPLALALTALVGRLRERLGRETERGRRRKLRRLVRRRLRTAEMHLVAERTGPFFMEIDRVLRDLLSAKLGRSITGLRRDELPLVLTAAGMDAAIVEQTIAVLEECDRARFAPGTVSPEDLRAVLDRADDVVLGLERSPTRAGGAA